MCAREYRMHAHVHRPYKVLRHVIGRPASEDVVVYEEKDEAFYVGIHTSKSEQMVFISSGECDCSYTG
jgi:oligopeptidase B